jgi:hypothetical protein
VVVEGDGVPTMKPAIKRLLSALILIVLMSLLSGCYVAPGYSYVRGGGYGGDAYYGSGPAVVYNGYYPYGYGYGYGGYPYGYYGGYYGCCYGPGVIIGGGWYGRGYYGRGYYGRGGYGHGGYGHGGGGGHTASHGSSSGGGHYGGH